MNGQSRLEQYFLQLVKSRAFSVIISIATYSHKYILPTNNLILERNKSAEIYDEVMPDLFDIKIKLRGKIPHSCMLNGGHNNYKTKFP